MSTKISFGKHKNSTISEVMREDYNYLKWLKEQDDIPIELKTELKKYKLDDFELNFGKYKHKLVSHVQTLDPQYFKYLQNNEYIKTKMPQLKKAIDYYSQH